MYPTVTGSLAGGDYADGDRQGLAKVGRAAGCAPAPEPG
jgi:hypothetical protein